MTATETDFLIREPAEVYHTKASEYLSSHQLADFRRCPLLYRQKKLGLVSDEDRPAYVVGRALHTLVLEGRDRFEQEYAVGGPVNPRTGEIYGANTKAYAEWAAAQGKAVLTLAQFDLVENMADGVRANGMAVDLLSEGIPEGVVRAEYCGVPVQARIDSLAPMLTELAERMTEMLRPLIDWIRRNKELVVTAFKVAAGIAAGGVALMAVGAVVSAAGTVVGALAAGLSALGSLLGALISPLGLAVAGIAGLVYYSGAGSAALKWLAEMFAYLRDMALRAWGGIADAIAAGDLSLAMRIAWLTIKMLWQEGINWIYGKWVEFKDLFLTVWNEAVFGLSKMLTGAWYEGLKVFTHVVNAMRVAWVRFTTWAGNTWNKAQQAVGTVFLEALAKVGVLSEEELGYAKEDLARGLQEKIEGRTAAGQKDLAAISREWEGKIKELEEREAEALKALEEDKDAANRRRQERYEEDLRDAQEAVDKAKAEWERAMAEAAKRRAEIEQQAAPEGPPKPGEPDFAAAGKATVVGTFSAAVAARLGAGGPAERTARATEEAAGHLKFIRRRFEFTGPTTSVFQ